MDATSSTRKKVSSKRTRTTRQKKIVLNYLQSVRCHPTAEETYESVKKAAPKISLSTVYRILESLAEDGIILKLASPDGPMRFDGFVHNHKHIRCCVCGKTEDVADGIDIELKMPKMDINGFENVKVNLEITGICPECVKRSENIEKDRS